MNSLLLEYIILEFLLLAVSGLPLLWGNKGIILAGLVVTALNYHGNTSLEFWYWEQIIAIYLLLGLITNLVLNRKTENLRVVKVSGATLTSLLISPLFLPFFLGLAAWLLLIAIPLAFTYREIPKSVYLQIIFKFIFSAGWLIIGNILY